jgi:hypothetical protein
MLDLSVVEDVKLTTALKNGSLLHGCPLNMANEEDWGFANK